MKELWLLVMQMLPGFIAVICHFGDFTLLCVQYH